MQTGTLFVAAWLLVAASTGAYASESDDSSVLKNASLDDLSNPSSITPEGSEIPELRAEMLRSAAETVGFRGGLAERSEQLRQAIDQKGMVLDQMYDFAPLISNKGVLPPVIVEAQDLGSYSQNQIRVADQVYRIKVPERFVSNPLTWRDYLYAGLPTASALSLPQTDALPKGNDELRIWRKAVREGWEEGFEQADKIMMANFNRLTRDFTGMIRYSVLVQERKITLPVVGESQQTVSGDGNEMRIGVKNRRLLEKSQFVVDPKVWRPSQNSSVDNRNEPVQYKNRYQGIDLDETRFEQYPQAGQSEKVELVP